MLSSLFEALPSFLLQNSSRFTLRQKGWERINKNLCVTVRIFGDLKTLGVFHNLVHSEFYDIALLLVLTIYVFSKHH